MKDICYPLAFNWIVAALVCVSTVDGTVFTATFSMNGIKGTVTFSQSASANPTSITFALHGVSETLSWKIHDLPVIYIGNAVTTCNRNATGGVYDPDNSATASCSTAQKRSCAIGDLSGKFGNLNQTLLGFMASDSKLPLSGASTIFGRSLVLSTTGGEVKACALITSETTPVTAAAFLKEPIAGTVYFRQVSEYTETLVYSNLFFVNTNTIVKAFKWSIRENKVGEEMGCSNATAMYDPKSSVTGSCSKTQQKKCAVGDLTGKLGNISVDAATSGLSSTQVAHTALDLPLTGSHSVVGHSLFLYDMSNAPVTCANIGIIETKKAKVTFESSKNEGVSGSFKFSQASPFDPTKVDINLVGLQSLAGGYHVHVYPNPSYKALTGTQACSSSVAGGHLNPFGIVTANSPADGNGTDDQYETGDLSGKYGNFNNLTSYTASHSDFNLPLFGQYSSVGRSIVIHKNAAQAPRWVCSNVELDMANVVKMVAESRFTEPSVVGHIVLTQYKSKTPNTAPLDTAIYLDLTLKDGSTTANHNWHVHTDPVGDDATKPVASGRCSSVGGHFNPYSVDVAPQGNYLSTCTRSNPYRCEVGDLAAKAERYTMGSGPGFYTDVDAPLFGVNSVIWRGMVVHVKDGALPRLGCADVKPDTKYSKEFSVDYIKGATEFSKSAFISRLASALSIPSWHVTYVRTSQGHLDQCARVMFGIVNGGGDITQKLEEIKKNPPAAMAPYKPDLKCYSSSGSPDHTVHGLMLMVSLTSLFVNWRQ